MTDRDALLRAILEQPEEDTVRLVYADAIQDDEPERAEFIRLQIRMARFGFRSCRRPRPSPPGAAGNPSFFSCGRCEWCVAERRECELWKTLGESFDAGRLESRLWWEPWEGEGRVCVVRRGFTESATLSLWDVITDGIDLCRHQPVTALRLTDRSANIYYDGPAAVWLWDLCALSDITEGGMLPGYLPRPIWLDGEISEASTPDRPHRSSRYGSRGSRQPKIFASQQLAREAAERACLRWCCSGVSR